MDNAPEIRQGWKTKQVYAMAAFCLLLGLVVGYLFRGWASAAPSSPEPVQAAQPAPNESAAPHAMPSIEQMKAMADKKANPLIERVKSERKNAIS